jgi:1-acyl-sn-glycerol-3-phosphate acyltransferase
MFRRDIFGHLVFVKKLLISFIGVLTWPRFNWTNKTKIEGTEHLESLPQANVLFVSNHQTYFADVIAMLHVFCSVKCKFRNKISNPSYLLSPRHATYFVAARETMRAGLLPRIFEYVGSVSIERTFREAGKDINRKVKLQDVSNIGKALQDGWVITFPQGTTTPFAPGRRGTAHVIKKYGPVVVPVVIDGFNKAFDKKGLKLRKKNTRLSIRFKAPMQFDLSEDGDVMLERIMQAIEQSEEFREKAAAPAQ